MNLQPHIAKTASRQKMPLCGFASGRNWLKRRASARVWWDRRGKVASGQAIYAYVSGNPLAMIDPMGLSGNSKDRRQARRENERNTPPKTPDPNPDNRPYWERFAQFLSPFDYDRVCLEWECVKDENMCSVEDKDYTPSSFVPAYIPKVKELEPGCRCKKSRFRSIEINPQNLDWDDIADLYAKWRQRNTVRR